MQVQMAPVIDLEFADLRLPGTGEDLEAEAAGWDRRKLIDLLVADGLPFSNFFPGVFRFAPNLNGIFLHVLAVVEPLHGDGVIEGYRMVERDFEGCMV